MTQYIIAYIATAISFLVIDLLWLGVFAKEFYYSRLGALAADPVNVTAAAIFYALYIAGILIFAVHPAMQTGSWKTALMWGALFGFFCYMTYELTNWAVINNWPSSLVFVDILWGVVLTGATATFGYLITKLFI